MIARQCSPRGGDLYLSIKGTKTSDLCKGLAPVAPEEEHSLIKLFRFPINNRHFYGDLTTRSEAINLFH